MPKRKPPIPLYFTSLEIENVRCFGTRQRLDLTSGEGGAPARWTLILGDNGVGKTTLLECLAWMRLVPEQGFETGPVQEGDDSGEPPPLSKGKLGPALLNEENEILESLLRMGPARDLSLGATLSYAGRLASLDATMTEAGAHGKVIRTGVEITFTKRLLSEVKNRNYPKIENSLGGEFHEPLVVAYGANRQLGMQNLSAGGLEDPIASRMKDVTELYDVEEVLSSLDHAKLAKGSRSDQGRLLKQLKTVLARILPDDIQPSSIHIYPPDILGRPWEPSGVHLESFSGLVPLSALSLGYKSTIAWATDLAWRLLKRYPGSSDALSEPAVVLIDELDLHLHPLWQLRIIDDLSAIFPRTQFIATGHSPLMVQVAEEANLVLLRRTGGNVEIVNDPNVVRSWRVDQILTSELFSVPRARDRQTERLFDRRDELVDKVSRTAREEAELVKIRAQLSSLPTAQSPDDQKAMDLIREAAVLLRQRVSGK